MWPSCPIKSSRTISFTGGSPNQLAICFLEQHDPEPCAFDCPWHDFCTRFDSRGDRDPVEVLLNSGVKSITNWASGEILGYLCGQFEPGGHLCTRSHDFVLIDNECMWHSGPGDLWECDWLRHNGRVSKAGLKLASEVCKALCGLSDEELNWIGRVPPGFLDEPQRELYGDLRDNMRSAKRVAGEFLRSV